MRLGIKLVVALLLCSMLVACLPPQDAIVVPPPVGQEVPPKPSPSATPPGAVSPEEVRFAVIGDYGAAGATERDLAALVKRWDPDFIATTGDNNYPDGAEETIDQNIGQYFSSYIAPYRGNYGPGATENRFFPALGNHDWLTNEARPYLEYFTLPGNERYYDVAFGLVHLFILDSDPREPDGVEPDSTQGMWLKERLAGSRACWKVVVMHHAPFSSGEHGSSALMQWPYKDWGADVVLAGHDHIYERLEYAELPYFVVGLGGRSSYNFTETRSGSKARYNDDAGALLVGASGSRMKFQFMTRKNEEIETYRIRKDCQARVR